MTAATRRRDGEWRNARMPIGESIRTPARHAPPCGSASSIALPRRIELQKKGPKQRQTRFGQVTRPTGVSRASGRGSASGELWVSSPAAGHHHAQRPTRESQNPGRQSADRKQSNHCGNVSSGGGNWTPPQQPCSRPHHKTGQVRLPGHHGLDGAWHPGRRRADARWKEARSFGSLRVKNRSLDLARPVQPRGPVRREPADDFVILFDRESLALADPQEEPTIGSAEAPDCGFVQLACLAIRGDQAEQM